jgi:hypothetical protein
LIDRFADGFKIDARLGAADAAWTAELLQKESIRASRELITFSPPKGPVDTPMYVIGSWRTALTTAAVALSEQRCGV